MPASILLGAVLTFASVDGQQLQLTVSLTRSATVALEWGGQVRTSQASVRHRFQGLAAPSQAGFQYTLSVGSEAPRRYPVRAVSSTTAPFSIALYGDSRDGSGPHEGLLKALTASAPHVLVHTGDLVHDAGDEAGWAKHLALTLPLTASVPLVFSLGNHDLYPKKGAPPSRGPLEAAMAQIPPPDDPIAKAHKVWPQSYHVRYGPALFISLDSNDRFASSDRQLRFLEAVLTKVKKPKERVYIAIHQGPLSSGKRGGHKGGPALIELAQDHGVTAVLAGHDHTYERIERAGVTYLVSGGGGAPLYERARPVEGSQAFASTYNWVRLEQTPDAVKTWAYSLEGALLDHARLGAGAARTQRPKAVLWLAALLFLAGLSFAILKMLRRGASVYKG